MKEKLVVGTTIYEKQPRWSECDYHPQVIVKVDEDSIEVFEEGYYPNGKYFGVKIEDILEEKDSDGSVILVHY